MTADTPWSGFYRVESPIWMSGTTLIDLNQNMWGLVVFVTRSQNIDGDQIILLNFGSNLKYKVCIYSDLCLSTNDMKLC